MADEQMVAISTMVRVTRANPESVATRLARSADVEKTRHEYIDKFTNEIVVLGRNERRL